MPNVDIKERSSTIYDHLKTNGYLTAGFIGLVAVLLLLGLEVMESPRVREVLASLALWLLTFCVALSIFMAILIPRHPAKKGSTRTEEGLAQIARLSETLNGNAIRIVTLERIIGDYERGRKEDAERLSLKLDRLADEIEATQTFGLEERDRLNRVDENLQQHMAWLRTFFLEQFEEPPDSEDASDLPYEVQTYEVQGDALPPGLMEQIAQRVAGRGAVEQSRPQWERATIVEQLDQEAARRKSALDQDVVDAARAFQSGQVDAADVDFSGFTGGPNDPATIMGTYGGTGYPRQEVPPAPEPPEADEARRRGPGFIP